MKTLAVTLVDSPDDFIVTYDYTPSIPAGGRYDSAPEEGELVIHSLTLDEIGAVNILDQLTPMELAQLEEDIVDEECRYEN